MPVLNRFRLVAHSNGPKKTLIPIFYVGMLGDGRTARFLFGTVLMISIVMGFMRKKILNTVTLDFIMKTV